MQYGALLPDEYVLMKERAVNLKRCGDFDNARELYRRVLGAHPEDADTYKGLAKVDICRGDFNEAVYDVLMRLELVSCMIRMSGQLSALLKVAIKNIETFCAFPIQIKDFTIHLLRFLSKQSSAGEIENAIVTAAQEKDPYLMLGFCYVMMFPQDVEEYKIPRGLLKNYQNALAGCSSGPDFRDTPYENIIYCIGILMATANVRGNIADLHDLDALRVRWDRRPSYAVMSQTFPDKMLWRQEHMQRVVEATCAEIRSRFGCLVVPGKPVYIKDMPSDTHYSGWLDEMVLRTNGPLTMFHGAHAKLDDLVYARDVYAQSMLIELDPDDDNYVLSKFGVQSITDVEIAEWLSETDNRNVLCQGWRNIGGVKYRQYHWFDIIQV